MDRLAAPPKESPLTARSTVDSTELSDLRWSTRLLGPYAFACLLITLAILLQVAFRVGVPLAYQAIFDQAIAARDARLLMVILSWLMAGWLVHGGAGLAQDALSASISSRAMNDLRERMLRQLQRLPSAYFASADSGDTMSRFSNDLAVVEEAMTRGLNTAVFSILNLGGSLALLFVVEWRLAFFTLAALTLSYFGPRLLGPRARDRAYERKTSEAQVAAAVQESIAAHSTVQAFDLRNYVLGNFRFKLQDLASKVVSAHVATALVGRTASQIVFMVQILVMGIGAWLTIQGTLSIGALIGFAALMQNVANASNHLATVTPDLLRASGGVRRVREFLSEEPDPSETLDAGPIPRLSEDLTFDRVGFAYDGARPLIEDLSFRIRAGESIALVGPSGSGKSTVLNLLLRLRSPDSGAVRFDGTDIRRAQEASLRSQIGIVLQETVLLNASFAENIRLGRLDASRQEIVEAAKQADIHQAILDKPDGYDTPVGEGGRHLSVGQRQRIGIARALLRDPAILVLDEATSALDPSAEAAIHRTLAEVGRGRTVVSATHRLTSAVEVDRILVFEKGSLVEEGRHRELIERGGVYKRLWRKQSGFEISSTGIQAQVTGARLHQVPIFHGIAEASLDSIAERFSSQVIPKGRFVFHQGDLGESFFIIVKGRVEVLEEKDGREHLRAVLEDGDFFGEMALLDAKPRSASIRTAMPSLLLVLQSQPFHRFLEAQPELRRALEAKAKSRRAGQP
ncbi:MAG: ABC transporter transmembrane domain-containing protein [Acidobacteriota bacterium]